MKTTWEKILEYASMPKHGTLSRKLRKGVALQINEGKIYDGAILFLGEDFIRVTEEAGDTSTNSYYDWNKVETIRTIASKNE